MHTLILLPLLPQVFCHNDCAPHGQVPCTDPIVDFPGYECDRGSCSRNQYLQCLIQRAQDFYDTGDQLAWGGTVIPAVDGSNDRKISACIPKE